MGQNDPMIWWVKIKNKCYLLSSCLVGAGRTLLFMVEQVFLLMEEVCSMLMQIHGAQAEKRGGQRGEKSFLICFVLPWNVNFISQFLLLIINLSIESIMWSNIWPIEVRVAACLSQCASYPSMLGANSLVLSGGLH